MATTIIERLEGTNLRRFAAPLGLMLERVSCMEVALECSEDRADALLCQYLETCATLELDEVREPLAQFCMGLPALSYRLGAPADSTIWNPLHEPLAQFQERYGEPLVWFDGDPLPSLPDILVWFRAWGC